MSVSLYNKNNADLDKAMRGKGENPKEGEGEEEGEVEGEVEGEGDKVRMTVLKITCYYTCCFRKMHLLH